MLDDPRLELILESLPLKPPNAPRLDELLPRLRLPIRSPPPPPARLETPARWPPPTLPRLAAPPRLLKPDPLPKLARSPTPPGRVVLPRLPPCRPIWPRALRCRLARESPRVLPPNLFAVFRSGYGVPPRWDGLCCHLFPPPPRGLPRLPLPRFPRFPPSGLTRLPPPRFPRLPLPPMLLLRLKLLLTLISTSPPPQPQPHPQPPPHAKPIATPTPNEIAAAAYAAP